MAPSTTNAWAVVLVVLAACGGGGGGGGGGGETCPPGSVIGIYPASLRVTAGTGPFEFGGGVSNCTADSHWSLTGPGSIDRTSGVPIYYTPPASVDDTTTATLTMSMGGLSISATITIDPSSVTLHGRVLLSSGGRAAGATVRVGTATAVADGAGSFTLPGVSVPYDLYVTSSDDHLTSVYPGLRRADPTPMLFDADYLPTTWVSTIGTLGGYAAGTLSGGAGFPGPAGSVAAVAFSSPETQATCPADAGTGVFSLQASWTGPGTTTGNLHALQWSTDGDGMPVSYEGYGTRGGVTITAGASLAGQDLVLAATTTSTLSGTTSDSESMSLAARVTLADGTWLRFLPEPGASTFVVGRTSPYTLKTPVIPGSAIDLMARRDYVDWAYQEVHLHGLSPSASSVTFFFGGLPQTSTPSPGATNVGVGTLFGWYTMPDSPVYVVSFRPGIGAPVGSPGYDVLIAGSNQFIVPDGVPLPSNTPYTWRVRGSSAFSTVEDAAGPQGFLATAPFYRIGQGTSSSFTTAP